MLAALVGIALFFIMVPNYTYIPNERLFIKALDQLEIWSDVLEQEIEIDKRVTNILRNDTSPGAWIEPAFYDEEILILSDFANPTYNTINVVRAWSLKYNVTFRQAMLDISSTYEPKLTHIQHGYKLLKWDNVVYTSTSNLQVPLTIERRTWNEDDKAYWNSFGITIKQLTAKGAVPVYKYKYGTKTIVSKEYTYWLPESRHSKYGKLYRPFAEKSLKWIHSNMTKEHYWTFIYGHKEAILSKSFKDGLVLSNLASHDVFCLPNEGILPSTKLLGDLKRYDKVIIFLDNDDTGIKVASVISTILMSAGISCRIVYSDDDELSDAAEIRAEKGADALTSILKPTIINNIEY